MKTAFLCGSLEPGLDGVGDYTRRLAGELIRQGHPSLAISLNDPHVSKPRFESQKIEGVPISVLRLPENASWRERITAASNWLDNFNPDRMSLQFVPFGFHKKGLCFGLGKSLAALNKKTWHVMFHELWLGLGENSTFKHRALGLLQRWIILDLMGHLRPRIVHTQTEAYRMALRRTNIVASILPLFGNIPRVNGDGWNGLLEPLITEVLGKCPDRNELYLAGIFGAVPPEWNAETTVNTLLPLVQRFKKRLVLVFYGKNKLTPQAINHLRLVLRNRADVIVTGERNSEDISKILQTLDLGLATTPRQVIQKSGSVAAMLEHGLQVLVTRDDWRLRGHNAPLEPAISGLLSPKQFDLLKNLPARNLQSLDDNNVKNVADMMLAAFKSSPSANGGI